MQHLKKHYSKVILGGGISGLIALHYNSDAVLFEAGNSIASDFLEGLFPKYVHCSLNVTNLCKELNVKIKKERFVIQIIYKGKEINFFNNFLSGAEKIEIYNDYCYKKYGEIKQNKMNGFVSGENERYYVRNKDELVKKLYHTNKSKIFLRYKANEIDLKNHVITFEKNRFIEYDNLISTIPIDIFYLISNVQAIVEMLQLNLLCCYIKNRRHELLENDFVYVPDSNYTFHRINIHKDKKILIFEFCDDTSCPFDMSSFLGEKKFIVKNTFEKRYLFPCVKNPISIENVKFLGRFATGDYEIKIDNVIEEMEKVRT